MQPMHPRHPSVNGIRHGGRVGGVGKALQRTRWKRNDGRTKPFRLAGPGALNSRVFPAFGPEQRNAQSRAYPWFAKRRTHAPQT